MKRKKRIQFLSAALLLALAVLLGACSGGGAVYELADEAASGSSSEEEPPDPAMSGETQSDSLAEPASSAEESGDPAQPLEPETIPDSSAPEESADIQVYICGAVAAPGVYELPAGSRVVQAIREAGGLLPEADERTLNQARLLVDGEQITVWTKEEAEALGVTADSVPPAAGAAGGEDTGTAADDGRVNLNTATKEELMTLPGVGESRADAILRYREEHGGFSDIEEVMNIEGIKEKMFEKIKGSIEV